MEKAWARDFDKKKIFGVQKRFDGEELIELILKHPKASEFVVKKLWTEFISLDPIPKHTLSYWSDAFRKTNYEISELLTVILNSSYFWDDKYRGISVKSPSELLVGMIRVSKIMRYQSQCLMQGLLIWGRDYLIHQMLADGAMVIIG